MTGFHEASEAMLSSRCDNRRPVFGDGLTADIVAACCSALARRLRTAINSMMIATTTIP